MPYLKIFHDDSIYPPIQPVHLPTDVKKWLQSVYQELGCSWIETAPTCLRGIVLVVDEEGKLKDDWEQRINAVATKLYNNPYDVIVGDAILCRVEGENLAPLTPEQATYILDHT